MSDTPPPDDGGAAEPEVQPARRSLLSRVSVVWVVPIAALLISLGIVWQSWSEQGRLIEIAFNDASGVRAEETQLRYRNVVVGIVEGVTFTDNLEQVLVQVRLDKGVGQFVDEDAVFWVVRPEVSAQGVSGLETVLSGVYLEGSWDGVAGPPRDRFDGNAAPPLVRYGQEGLSFRLTSSSVEGLSAGAPILYRGIAVGSIGNLRLSDDGVSVTADAFIRAPESNLVNSATRFWDTSGFTFSFGASGAQLDVQSIASLVSGGVAFDTTVSGGDEVESGAVFRLYPDEGSARNSIYNSADDGNPVSFSIIFDETVPGLEVGADVDFGGLTVGSVAALTGLLDEERFGDRAVRLLTTIEIQPGKIGLGADATEDELIEFLVFAVQNGLRAQLQSASLLGGLQIGLVQLDEVPAENMDLEAEPFPRIPSVDAELSDFADTAEGVFNRVNNLPIEELLDGAINVMASVNNLLNDEGVTQTPQEVLAILGDVRRLVASEGIQGIPDQASGVMSALQDTAEQLQQVVTELSDAGAVEALVDALTAAEEAADSVYAAVEEVPATLAEIDAAVASLDALIVQVNELPLADVIAEVEGSVAALRTLLAAPATQGLTGDVSRLLGEVEGLVAEVRASGVVGNANAALAELQTTVDEVAAELTPLFADARSALASAQGSIDAMPGVIENIDALSSDLDAFVRDLDSLPLDQVVTNVNSLLTSIDVLLSQPSTINLPEQVSLTLSEARRLLSELTDGGLIQQATGTLASAEAAVTDITERLQPVLDEAQRAATQVAEAADSAPAIAERAETISIQIEALLARADQLPLEELTRRTSDLVATADTLIGSEDTQRLPGALSDALEEVQRLLIQVQEGGLIENANATLSAAETAATSIAQASGELPALVARFNTLLTESEAVIGGYEANGPLGTEARSALREIRGAAKSVDALARQLERSPNSLLFGR